MSPGINTQSGWMRCPSWVCNDKLFPSWRAETAVRPYTEDLDRLAKWWTAHPFCVGEGCHDIRLYRLSIGVIECTYRLRSRHKKTTHALHRRLAFTSTVLAADVITLPSWAEFCIRGGIIIRWQNNKSSHQNHHNHLFPIHKATLFQH